MNKRSSKRSITYKKWAIVALLCIPFLSFQTPLVLAETLTENELNLDASLQTQPLQETPSSENPEQPKQETFPESYPYEKTFIISAYYSPLPDQQKYVTGSYQGDIRLNGRGVRGADGTAVYPGMIAAPKTYPFGTKMKIPGIGIVAVHDRGGAIVVAGERNQAHDRLDVWMGYGDIGLKRALQWGKRTVQVTVYGINPSIQEEVYLEGYSEAEKYVENAVEKTQIFQNDLSLNDKGEDVKKLQEALQKFGLYSGEIHESFNEATRRALIQFQIKVGIVDSQNDFGAGYFGPQTRRAMEREIAKETTDLTFSKPEQSQQPSNLPGMNLGQDDSGEDVKKLQEILKQLGYDVEVSGIYDEKTIEAIFQFQKQHRIVFSKSDKGAGFFGPKTYQTLVAQIHKTPKDQGGPQLAVATDFSSNSLSFDPEFSRDLALGAKGEDVKRLQEELRKLNLLRVQPTGYYGEVTQHAIFKFQQNKGILQNKTDYGAGTFGVSTRKALNDLIALRKTKEYLVKERSETQALTLAGR